FFRSTEVVIGMQRRFDTVVLQELAAVARILRCNACDAAQHVQGPLRNVAKVPDWRGHDVQLAAHVEVSTEAAMVPQYRLRIQESRYTDAMTKWHAILTFSLLLALQGCNTPPPGPPPGDSDVEELRRAGETPQSLLRRAA